MISMQIICKSLVKLKLAKLAISLQTRENISKLAVCNEYLEILLIDFLQNFQIDLWLQGRQSVNVKVWANFYAPNQRYHLKHKKISQNGGP